MPHARRRLPMPAGSPLWPSCRRGLSPIGGSTEPNPGARAGCEVARVPVPIGFGPFRPASRAASRLAHGTDSRSSRVRSVHDTSPGADRALRDEPRRARLYPRRQRMPLAARLHSAHVCGDGPSPPSDSTRRARPPHGASSRPSSACGSRRPCGPRSGRSPERHPRHRAVREGPTDRPAGPSDRVARPVPQRPARPPPHRRT